MKRLWICSIVLALMVPMLAWQATPSYAQSGQRCFPETGQCISGPIRQYWETNGGLPVFGFPITTQREELVEGRSLQIQWFERDRIEIQPNGLITAGRLGARYLELKGFYWQEQPNDQQARNGCRFFRETQFNLCQPFLRYWEQNGGLARFGYPITSQRTEVVEGREYTVQYFERRRMEYHPENRGTPYEVLLGLLGRDIERATVCPAAPTENLQRAVRAYLHLFNCPSGANRGPAPVAWQRYERGWMFWISATSSAPPMIFILFEQPGQNFADWTARTDTYREGEAVGGTVPPGRIAPSRGFGKIWWSDPVVRDRLGWPSAIEQSGSGAAVAFNSAGWMIEYPIDNLVIMQPDGRAFGVRANILQR